MSYTYAILEVSKQAYDEIKDKLLAAGYGTAIHKESEGKELIDMHGIALKKEEKNAGT